MVPLLGWAVAGQLILVLALVAALGMACETRGEPRGLLWAALSWLILGLLLLGTACLVATLLSWFGVLVGAPLAAAGGIALAYAWLTFDQWRRGRRRSPGRLHGWVVRVREGRLRLMPTPA